MNDDNSPPKKRQRLPPECEQEEDVDLLPIKSKTLLNNKQKLSHLGGLCNDYGIPINVLQLKYLWLI